MLRHGVLPMYLIVGVKQPNFPFNQNMLHILPDKNPERIANIYS